MKSTMGAVDKLTLTRWREMDAIAVLSSFADHAKVDPSFHPRISQQTSRWHVRVAGREWELLCTGPKFWDVQAERGGGGAVDIAMYLYGLPFKAAVSLLKEKGL
jgi:hypothetical protein